VTGTPPIAVGAGAKGPPRPSPARWLASAPSVISFQRVQFGRAGLDCFGELWDEVGDGSMPVGVADLDEESVEEKQFADAPQAVDCFVCAGCVSAQSTERRLGQSPYRLLQRHSLEQVKAHRLCDGMKVAWSRRRRREWNSLSRWT
jgi:hypothetical protein